MASVTLMLVLPSEKDAPLVLAGLLNNGWTLAAHPTIPPYGRIRQALKPCRKRTLRRLVRVPVGLSPLAARAHLRNAEQSANSHSGETLRRVCSAEKTNGQDTGFRRCDGCAGGAFAASWLPQFAGQAPIVW